MLRFVYYCTMYALVSQFWSAQFEQNVAGANEKRICFSDNFPCVYTRSFFFDNCAVVGRELSPGWL